MENKKPKLENKDQAAAAKDLPYMSQEELQELIKNQKEIVLTKPEIEYLHLRRRRMSIDMVRLLDAANAIVSTLTISQIQ